MSVSTSRGFIPIIVTAAIAIALLIVVGGAQLGAWWKSKNPVEVTPTPTDTSARVTLNDNEWREELIRLGIVASSSESTATSSDPLLQLSDIVAEQMLNGYLSLKASGDFSPQEAARVGQYIGANIVPSPTHTPHTLSELSTDDDTSKERVLTYRADMREALAPLISGEEDELTLFARYIERGDPKQLDAIRVSAEQYKKAEKLMLTVVVPKDAASLHLRGVNSLGAYANTLDRLVLFSGNPLATLALLRTYNEAEREMLFAFDALARYYVQKSTN